MEPDVGNESPDPGMDRRYRRKEATMNKRGLALLLIPGLAFLALFNTGCATKKFVNQEVAGIDKKIEDVAVEVEANQKRIREHDERLATIGELVSKQDSQFKSVDIKIDEVKGLIRGHLIAEETLHSSDAKFGFGSSQLTPEAKAVVDSFVQKLIEENKGVYLEIQGHTDNTGPEEYNLALGKSRADAVRDYLYRQHHIPLHRMEVISYGSSKPLSDKFSREGRAQNRRIEILVFE
jgi:outer membrane protein OmpA-like peptidoglycan-associated protein